MAVYSKRFLSRAMQDSFDWSSYIRVAATLALLCIAGFEAFNVISQHPVAEIGSGMIAGAILAAILKSVNIL